MFYWSGSTRLNWSKLFANKKKFVYSQITHVSHTFLLFYWMYFELNYIVEVSRPINKKKQYSISTPFNEQLHYKTNTYNSNFALHCVNHPSINSLQRNLLLFGYFSLTMVELLTTKCSRSRKVCHVLSSCPRRWGREGWEK